MVKDTRSTGRSRRAAAAALVAVALVPEAAWAGLCNLTVHRSERGAKIAEAERYFQPAEQFIVCFTAAADGYVSLWDRIPATGPLQRLAPNDLVRGEAYANDQAHAVAVSSGEERCFGDGSGGYLLNMEPADGLGRGMFWLVFTERAETQPTQSSFETADAFRARFADAPAAPIAATFGGCKPEAVLRYGYSVGN